MWLPSPATWVLAYYPVTKAHGMSASSAAAGPGILPETESRPLAVSSLRCKIYRKFAEVITRCEPPRLSYGVVVRTILLPPRWTTRNGCYQSKGLIAEYRGFYSHSLDALRAPPRVWLISSNGLHDHFSVLLRRPQLDLDLPLQQGVCTQIYINVIPC